MSSSYRTYEEWKLASREALLQVAFQFLPYLWGMETNVSSYTVHILKRPFLPYLWGMETISERFDGLFELFRSYRTYEEWKLSRL